MRRPKITVPPPPPPPPPPAAPPPPPAPVARKGIGRAKAPTRVLSFASMFGSMFGARMPSKANQKVNSNKLGGGSGLYK